MPKGTSRAEATSNSEEIKPVALAVIELRYSLKASGSFCAAITQFTTIRKISCHFSQCTIACSILSTVFKATVIQAKMVYAKQWYGQTSAEYNCLIA